MRHLILLVALILVGCGSAEETSFSNAGDDNTDAVSVEGSSKALMLEPEIRPEGIDSLYSRLTVTDLKFYGALHLIPAADTITAAAQSTAFKFEFGDGIAQTTTVGRPLRVFGAGHYHVLMTIHPFEGGHSVDISGSVFEVDSAAQSGKACVDEAAPTTADDSEMEAAPTTADIDDEMEAAPVTADEEDMEAAPITANEGEMEAAPTAANENEMEAAPITANEGEMEAAPTTADGETSMADNRRNRAEVCLWESRYAGGSKFETSSSDSYEFDLGTVLINSSDAHLILNWDMSDWMGLVMGEALGLSFVEMVALHNALSTMGETGEDDNDSFTPDRVRLEAN
jgi:hypothetical protein